MTDSSCLQGAKLFSDMLDHDIESLSRKSRIHTVSKGEAVFMQGDPSRSIYFLKEGIIKVSRINADGRKLTIDLIEAGEFFGELCLAGEKERRTTAEALVDAVCCEINKEPIEVHMQRRPDFALKLIELIGDRRLSMENLLEDMAFMEIPARIAALLLKYAESSIVKIPFTHQEIADLTGATRVSVSRCIAKMRSTGLIETNGERIKLINMDILHSHAQLSAGFF